jgi:hypothetical protein
MEHIEFYPPMGGKKDFIHIRSDSELKAALDAAAKRADRKYTDQARYLLRLALGLVSGDDDQVYRDRITKTLTEVPASRPAKKGGASHK